MSNEIAIQEKADLMSALKNSLYPGATDESCELVLAFCRASGMNPLLKPVHIVPMRNPKEGKSKDTIMPGIGMYRINAERSGAYAGLSEPEFGPDVKEEFPAEEYEKEWNGKKTKHTRKAVKLTYPKWCKITVKKIVAGQIYEFTALEFWKENYATASRDSEHPNEMWSNRPYGQLAKCAEAQALRKAFPDRVSSQATAEEVEGKFQSFSGPVVEAEPYKTPEPQGGEGSTRKRTPKKDEKPSEASSHQTNPTNDPPSPQVFRISPEELEAVKAKWKMIVEKLSPGTRVDGAKYLKEKFGFERFEDIHPDQLIEVLIAMDDIKEPGQPNG